MNGIERKCYTPAQLIVGETARDVARQRNLLGLSVPFFASFEHAQVGCNEVDCESYGRPYGASILIPGQYGMSHPFHLNSGGGIYHFDYFDPEIVAKRFNYNFVVVLSIPRQRSVGGRKVDVRSYATRSEEAKVEEILAFCKEKEHPGVINSGYLVPGQNPDILEPICGASDHRGDISRVVSAFDVNYEGNYRIRNERISVVPDRKGLSTFLAFFL